MAKPARRTVTRRNFLAASTSAVSTCRMRLHGPGLVQTFHAPAAIAEDPTSSLTLSIIVLRPRSSLANPLMALPVQLAFHPCDGSSVRLESFEAREKRTTHAPDAVARMPNRRPL